MPRAPPSDEETDRLWEIVTPLVLKHHLTQKEIAKVLRDDYGPPFVLPARTLRRCLQEFNLSTAPPPPLDDQEKQEVFNLVKHYHSKRLHKREVLDLIKTKHTLPELSTTMLGKISINNRLNWRLDDIQLGVIDLEDLANMVINRKDRQGYSNAGLRRLTNIMSVNVNLRINRTTMNAMLHALDPDGIRLRVAHRLKRRAFHVDGPDMIWSFDGHDKLKSYRICIYGGIDAWSRKVISLEVGSNNNNPRRIGVYFLRTVARCGGIPMKTSTDHGTETLEIAQHQLFLHHLIGGVPQSNVSSHHLFTTSTWNQKIEMLWSQLMRAKNVELRENIEQALEMGVYNDAIPLQK